MSDLRFPGGVADANAGVTCTAESVDTGCITCGDVAVVLTVETVDGADAQCRDEQGREELVATELVGPVARGDRVLVHAGVAIERVSGETAVADGAAAPEART